MRRCDLIARQAGVAWQSTESSRLRAPARSAASPAAVSMLRGAAAKRVQHPLCPPLFRVMRRRSSTVFYVHAMTSAPICLPIL